MSREEVINIQSVAALEMELELIQKAIAGCDEDIEKFPEDFRAHGRKSAYEHAKERLERCLKVAKGEYVPHHIS
ncbi:hypothetical protein AM501_07825 [Aneurinibacillus migulanus]|uniref:hypothetical protein n=1 Tax=Aneurinibacillus migulanus TaxID=47500 RepID=UPI0005BE1082|nr:hypothetical protein [Aneurinibacillus migulanus]KIV55025.1 hypothetical protein TS64_12130 [Aneurinibacillus migulanus]KPD08828.1 hypothetical protein AM501_07825 [Aneurinibacillus migulanus]